MAESFKSNAYTLPSHTKSIPVEHAHSMTVSEWYHQPIHRAFKVIRTESPDIDDDATLQMAVNFIKDSIGPHRLIPMLLVYSAMPNFCLLCNKPTHLTFARAVALRKTTSEMRKYFSKHQIRDVLRTRNGPEPSAMYNMPIASNTLVYRSKKDKWEGLLSVLDINVKDVSVILPPLSGPNTFRDTMVKPSVNGTDNPSLSAQ